MTLAFSTKWPERMGALANQPNFFVSKTWASIIKSINEMPVQELIKTFQELDGLTRNRIYTVKPKKHTIRAGHRWRAGMKIHPVINNRTKDRFQFTPVIECKSVQEIKIEYEDGLPNVYIDNHPIYWHTRRNTFGECNMHNLAVNDGFSNLKEFFAYFNTNFKGQIIHWTNLKY
jgi:hypothetical protein